jgi:hypothetical protein
MSVAVDTQAEKRLSDLVSRFEGLAANSIDEIWVVLQMWS